MKAIIARNRGGWIGLNGRLPWESSEDLRHFKILTMGCKLLVGYRTALELPSLPGREIIVDKRDGLIDNVEEIDWCIGGRATYEKYCHLFDSIHVSLIDDGTVGDVKFPDLRNTKDDCKYYYYNFLNDKR